MSSKVNCPSHPDAALVEDHRAGDMICSGLITHTTYLSLVRIIDSPGGLINDLSSIFLLCSSPVLGVGTLGFFELTRHPSRPLNLAL